jgi:hypothetical protein
VFFTRSDLSKDSETFEVSVGLGFSHGAPRPGSEQLMGEVNDTGPHRNLAKPQQLLESVLVMNLDLGGAAREVTERLAVGREHGLDVGKCGEAIK